MDSGQTGLVSVVIPVSDRTDQVYGAVLSVLAQTHSNLQVIVVENNSQKPEETLERLDSLGDYRVRVFSLSPCDNANCARNFGVERAEGEYVAFLDSDDEWMPDHLAASLETLSHSGADFVYGSIIVNEGKTSQINRARRFRAGESAADYLVGREISWAQTSTYLMKREVAATVRWDERLRRHQDFDFFCGIAQRYKLAVKYEPSVQVNWLSVDKKKFNPQSVLLFYRKWRQTMSYETRRYYCKRRLRYFAKSGEYLAAMQLAGILVALPFSHVMSSLLSRSG